MDAVCSPDSTNPLTTIEYTNVYRCPFSGGGFFLYRRKWVAGREGLPDTLNVPDDGSYYITTSSLSGKESCASSVVSGPITTGVPVEENNEKHILSVKWFDVQGRLIQGSLIQAWPSGIYFKRIYWSDGSIDKEKVLHIK